MKDSREGHRIGAEMTSCRPQTRIFKFILILKGDSSRILVTLSTNNSDSRRAPPFYFFLSGNKSI